MRPDRFRNIGRKKRPGRSTRLDDDFRGFEASTASLASSSPSRYECSPVSQHTLAGRTCRCDCRWHGTVRVSHFVAARLVESITLVRISNACSLLSFETSHRGLSGRSQTPVVPSISRSSYCVRSGLHTRELNGRHEALKGGRYTPSCICFVMHTPIDSPCCNYRADIPQGVVHCREFASMGRMGELDDEQRCGALRQVRSVNRV